MIQRLCLFICSALVSCSVLAGGSIFGHSKTSNPEGVLSIGVHICGQLNCPEVIIKEGDCTSIEHATMKYGVCVCDEGWKVQDDKCVVSVEETDCSLSNCMLCETDETGKNTNSFLPMGTACEQGGLSGVCNGLGQCIPAGGTPCETIDKNGCGEGYFCNYGGTFGQVYSADEECEGRSTQTRCYCSDYDVKTVCDCPPEYWNADTEECTEPGYCWEEETYGKSCVVVGYTPNVCEKANPRKIMVDGTMYYFPSAKELKSFCRPADSGQNCTWGYLSWYGAQSYCQSLGKKILKKEEVTDAVASAIFQANPLRISYWIQEGTVSFKGINEWSFYDWLGRPDGYAGGASVICK